MKRLLCLLLALVLLPTFSLGEDVAAAPELDVIVSEGRSVLEQTLLRDNRDDTAYACKRGKTVTLSADIPADTPCGAVYLRMDVLPDTAALYRKGENGRWQEVVTLANPGPMLILRADEAITGAMELRLTFAAQVTAQIAELRVYGVGVLPATLRAWETAGHADILLLTDTLSAVDTSAVAAWIDAGRTVAVASLTAPQDNAAAALDALWQAGLRTLPSFGGYAPVDAADADALLTAWHEKSLLRTLVGWVRAYQPMLLVLGGTSVGGDLLTRLKDDMVADASDTAWETEEAAADGLWVVPQVCSAVEESALNDALAAWEPRTDRYLREMCAAEFADAVHGDASSIPYPADRLADGYLAAGDFVYESPEDGLWAYVSTELQVEIVRYEQPDIPRVWFVTDVQFKPESVQFGQVLYADAAFEDQQTYPETLAQSANLVVGVNGDYYPYRVSRKQPVGNVMRQGTVLYDFDPKKTKSYPNLDTLALRDDGTLSVYAGAEVTATELAEEGGVHDVLSFGPYLARDGVLRVYAGAYWADNEPRNAIGMISAGHYRLVTVEGRFAAGPAGVDLNTLARLIYAQGVTDAFNLDGGSTAVLIFMGKKLNRTASKSGKSETSPRNMHELFGPKGSASGLR